MSRSESGLARAFEYGVVCIAALAFAASYGFNYGFDNQVVYFLKSLALTDKSLLRADWFTHHTTQYHRVFIYFGAALLELNKKGWAVAIAQFLAVFVGALCMYRIVKRVAGATLGIAAFLLLLSMLFITRTSSVGASYLFDTIMQPSTLGALGSVAGTLFFIEERWLYSGICLAAGGAFHANYLVLAYPIFGLAHLALGFKDLKKRLIEQFAPLVAVTIALSPLLLAASHTKASPEAQEILFRIRSPHHYNPAHYERNFMPFAAWQLLGIGSGWLIHRTPNGRRLGAVFTGLLATIWTGTILTTFVDIPKVTQIFVWRFAPNADLMGQILVACALAQVLARPRILRSYAPVALGLVCAGLGVFGLYFRNKDGAQLPRLLFTFFGIAVAARVLDLALDLLAHLLPSQQSLVALAKRWLGRSPLVIGALMLYLLAPDRVAQGYARSNLLKEQGGSQADLYRWLRESSPKDAVYLTPPDLEDTRFLGQRAIVVDWKAVPLIPTELLGWYERLCDVSGRRIGGPSDLNGYGAMDPERLAMIVSKYHPDYVVLRRGGERRFPELAVAYKNNGYSVLKIAPPSAQP
ncbi:MAG TPA: DUF6798 domain-containing protein [Polyangiaceae bacterium]|jgi:4-amino-4-deoxy-L-arabinose transferase-like glycosyltransferase